VDVGRSLKAPATIETLVGAPLVHGAQARDQRFRVRASLQRRRLSGLFLGTYSALPYTAPCRVAVDERLARCGFKADPRIELRLHGAAEGMHHACALLNLTQERSHARNGQVEGSSLVTSTK
jgi:hypothetical protein